MNTHVEAVRDLADKFHFTDTPPSPEDLKRHVLPLLTERALTALEGLSRSNYLPIVVTPGTTLETLRSAKLIAQVDLGYPAIMNTNFGKYVYDWWLDTQSVPEPELIDDVLTVLNNTTLMSELIRISIVGHSVCSGVSINTREKLVRLGFIEHQGYTQNYPGIDITERGKQAIRALRAGVVTALHPSLVELLKEFNEKDECMLDDMRPVVSLARQLVLIQRLMVDPVGRVDGKLKYLLTQQGMIIKTILTI